MALTRCMPCVCVAFVHAVVEYAGHPSIISVMTVTTVTNKHETTTVFFTASHTTPIHSAVCALARCLSFRLRQAYCMPSLAACHCSY